MSKRVCLASMGVKVNNTVDGQIQEIFQNVYLVVMSVETWAKSKEEITEMYAFVHQNLTVHTEN